MEKRSDFADWCRKTGVRTVAMFGDSITEGMAATAPERAWTGLFAAATGTTIVNRAISGTVLQNSPDASGAPRLDNGFSRHERDLLAAPTDAICIHYGYNDARYTAAPETFNVAAFLHDYRELVGRLLSSDYARKAIVIGSPPYIPDAGFLVGSLGFTGQARAGFEAHVAAVRSLAQSFSLAYAAVYELMAMQPDGSLASSDITHPNDAGYQLIAQAFLEAAIQD